MTYIDVKTDQQYEGWSEVLILHDQFQAVCALLRHVRSIRKDNMTHQRHLGDGYLTCKVRRFLPLLIQSD